MRTLADWHEVTIDEFGEIVGGGTPSRSFSSFWNGSIPWVTPSEITALPGKYVHETKEMITRDGLAGSAARLLPVGSIIVTTRATLGETAIAAVPLATNQGFKSIVPNDATDSRFTYYHIQTLKPEMLRLASGTTFLEISKADFSRIRTRRPNREEQSRIAAVLDAIDVAIAKTGAVIAKLRHVRTGLLHNLLTRGLDHDGQLRDPNAHPDQFCDSLVGQIPKEWRTSPLSAECPLKRGFDITVSQQRDGRIPVVSSSGINSFHDTPMVEGPGVVTGRKGKLGEVFYLERSFWPHDTTLWVTNFNGNSPRFIALLLTSMRLERFDAATSVPTLNRNTVHPLVVTMPPVPEQHEIVQRVCEFDENLAMEKLIYKKLMLLKSGLMADLITGSVRVPQASGVMS